MNHRNQDGRNALQDLGDCVAHYLHQGMDHGTNGMFKEIGDGTMTMDDVMQETLGEPAYSAATETFFEETFDMSPGNPHNNVDCSVDCAAWADDHWDAAMRTGPANWEDMNNIDPANYPYKNSDATNGDMTVGCQTDATKCNPTMPVIQKWVYDESTGLMSQSAYKWKNAAKCNKMVDIPEDSCNAMGEHGMRTRKVHKCEAMNEHGYNTELSGHMTQRQLRSIRKLSAKNKVFNPARKLSKGNRKLAAKHSLRKLKQKEHVERRRRLSAAAGATSRKLTPSQEKLEVLGVRYLLDNSKVSVPNTPKYHKLTATRAHPVVKRKLKSIRKKFGSLRKLTMRRK